MSYEERIQLKLKQGFPIYGVEMKVTDDAGKELPRDGKTFGHLVRAGGVNCSGCKRDELF